MSKRYAAGASLGTSRVFNRAPKRRPSPRQRVARATLEVLEARQLLSATYYVAPSGTDAGPGTLASPFRTIQDAANIAVSGDTVEIEGSTANNPVVYREMVKPVNSGVTFTNYNGEPVTISGADSVSGFAPVSPGSPISWAPIPAGYNIFTDGGDGTGQNKNIGMSDAYIDTAADAGATPTLLSEPAWPAPSFNVSAPTAL